MSDALLRKLAETAGINIDWTDAHGRPQTVSPEVQRSLLEEFGLPAHSDSQMQESLDRLQEQQKTHRLDPLIVHEQGLRLSFAEHFDAGTSFKLVLEEGQSQEGRLDEHACLPAISTCGYHQLQIADQQVTLAVAPGTCPSVDELTGQQNARIWGLTAQLYSLRRPGDGGLGDTAALESLARAAAARGADALAISPVHAMFSADSTLYSPYSPSSRTLYNILHSAPASVLGEQAAEQAITQLGIKADMDRLETLDLIDWPASSQLRMQMLRQLHDNFQSQPEALKNDLQLFIQRGGDDLIQHCRFEALHAVMFQQDRLTDWRHWPREFQDPQSTAVEQFAAAHEKEVDFHCFAQWLMLRGLNRAQKAARDAGMRIGLIADLAVGANGCGSQSWTRHAEFMPSISVGAPPDVLNSAGQNWGVSAFSPFGMRRNGFRSFIEMLQANLCFAGGIRIDHVMGLQRLWVMPQNASPQNGAYLDYPFQEQLRLLALEAWRHNALVIGEDLGTVPHGLREELARRHILGMRVLLFEQRHGSFIPSAEWPADALATTTTHDLPSIKGWFHGHDIDWRQRASHRSDEDTQNDRQQREAETAALRQTLRDEGHLQEPDHDLESLLDASIEFIGSTPAPLALLPLEDAMGSDEQPNLPGPGNEHPNWRRRWTEHAQHMLEDEQIDARLRRLTASRQYKWKATS